MSIEIICSTNSGLPSAARGDADPGRPRHFRARRATPRSDGRRPPSSSGSSFTVVRASRRRSGPSPGRRSSSSGRPTQSRRIGTDAVCRADVSRPARGASASAHCASSSTRTSGLAARQSREEPSARPRSLPFDPTLQASSSFVRPVSWRDRLGDACEPRRRAPAAPPAWRPRRPARHPRVIPPACLTSPRAART